MTTIILYHSMSEISHHGHWSHRSDTFEKHYYRPGDGIQRGTTIATPILENSENSTTSERGEVEPTEIVLGTKYNRDVGDTEPSDDVVGAP